MLKSRPIRDGVSKSWRQHQISMQSPPGDSKEAKRKGSGVIKSPLSTLIRASKEPPPFSFPLREFYKNPSFPPISPTLALCSKVPPFQPLTFMKFTR